MSQQQTNIKLIVSAGYLIRHRLWDRVCDALGWDVYSVVDGRMDTSELVTLDVTANIDLCKAICETAVRGER